MVVTKKKEKFIKQRSFETYVIKKGDSLWTISRKFKNVSVVEIKKWNNIWSVKS